MDEQTGTIRELRMAGQRLYDSVEAYHGPPDDEGECAVCIAMREWASLVGKTDE